MTGQRLDRRDPAARAAGLLLRIGFGLLVVVLPVAAVYSRRAVFILAPIGALVMIIASAVMEETPDPRSGLKRLLSGPTGLACAFLAAWSGLSLLWTPFPAEAAERLFRVLGALVLAAGAALALPERMRASNLYLLPVGTGAAAMLLLSNLLLPGRGSEGITLERGLITVTLLAWPAVAWLAIKRRSVPAMLIAALVGFAGLFGRVPDILPALVAGSVVLGGAMVNPRAVGQAVGAVMAGMVLLTPLAILVLAPLLGGAGDLGRLALVWSEVLLSDPIGIITGHGLDTALRSRVTSVLTSEAPRSLLFEVWYELGILGSLATAVALGFGAARTGLVGPLVAPFALGGMTFAFTLAVIGLGTAQTWWLSALGIAAVAFAAVANGQYRTVRPRATARPVV